MTKPSMNMAAQIDIMVMTTVTRAGWTSLKISKTVQTTPPTKEIVITLQEGINWREFRRVGFTFYR